MNTPTTLTGRATRPAALTAATWRTAASCQEYDLEQFFDDQPAAQSRLQGICRGCPVRTACLADTLQYEADRDMRWGVVGGLTTVQRRALRCEALLGHRPYLRQARELASPAWASRMMPLIQQGLTPEQIAVELRAYEVIASAVTVRVAVWWVGGKGSVVARRGPDDERFLPELVRDECRGVVEQLKALGASKRDVAAYLLVSEDSLGQAITAWRKDDAAAEEVKAA